MTIKKFLSSRPSFLKTTIRSIQSISKKFIIYHLTNNQRTIMFSSLRLDLFVITLLIFTIGSSSAIVHEREHTQTSLQRYSRNVSPYTARLQQKVILLSDQRISQFKKTLQKQAQELKAADEKYWKEKLLSDKKKNALRSPQLRR